MAGLPDRNKDGLTDAAKGHHDILKDKVLIRLQCCLILYRATYFVRPWISEIKKPPLQLFEDSDSKIKQLLKKQEVITSFFENE